MNINKAFAYRGRTLWASGGGPPGSPWAEEGSHSRGYLDILIAAAAPAIRRASVLAGRDKGAATKRSAPIKTPPRDDAAVSAALSLDRDKGDIGRTGVAEIIRRRSDVPFGSVSRPRKQRRRRRRRRRASPSDPCQLNRERQ